MSGEPDMPDPPTTGGAQPARDVLSNLATWAGSVLNDILRVMSDAEGGVIALNELGWTGGTPALPPALLSRLDQQAQGGTDASVQAAESFGEVVLALGTLGEAFVAAGGDQSSGVSALEIVADMLDLAMTLRMRE